MNKLYSGDCMTIMQQEMRASSVDLISLDPPFNSNRAYHAIYKDEQGDHFPSRLRRFVIGGRLTVNGNGRSETRKFRLSSI